LEIWNLPSDRYDAIEELRKILGFKKAEWKYLLIALAKTDNGWLQFMFGNVRVDLKKAADIDELHVNVKSQSGRTRKAVDYTYDLKEFTTPKSKSQKVSCYRK